MQGHARGSGRIRPMEPQGQLGQGSSSSHTFARRRLLNDTTHHPTRNGNPVFEGEIHLRGRGRKIAPSRLRMIDCCRNSREQVCCSFPLRGMVLVKGHDFLVTRASGSSEHVVATRAVPLLDV